VRHKLNKFVYYGWRIVLFVGTVHWILHHFFFVWCYHTRTSTEVNETVQSSKLIVALSCLLTVLLLCAWNCLSIQSTSATRIEFSGLWTVGVWALVKILYVLHLYVLLKGGSICLTLVNSYAIGPWIMYVVSFIWPASIPSAVQDCISYWVFCLLYYFLLSINWFDMTIPYEAPVRIACLTAQRLVTQERTPKVTESSNLEQFLFVAVVVRVNWRRYFRSLGYTNLTRKWLAMK